MNEDDQHLQENENGNGYFIVTDVLDLHGFFPEQVPEMIEEFIVNAMNLKLSKVRIIHGKGKSRLKWEVHNVLQDNEHVMKYYDAAPDTGGWGATIAELKTE